MPFRLLLTTWMAALPCLLCSSLHAQSTDDPSGLKLLYSDQQAKIESQQQEKRATLFAAYANAVQKIELEFQKQGDLEKVLKARKEAENARKGMTSKSPFPEVEDLRRVLNTELAKVEAEARESRLKLDQAYIAKMDTFHEQAAQKGDLDLALALLKEINRVKAGLADTEVMIARSSSPSSRNRPYVSDGRKSVELATTVISPPEIPAEKVVEVISLSPGIHNLPGEQVILGNRERPEGEPAPRGALGISPGTTVQNGAVYIDVGEVKARGSLFRNVKFSANLGGIMEASECLFDNSSVEKGGGWFSGYSSKWIMDDCVFYKNFIGNANFTRRSIGLKITNCTFVDVAIPPLLFDEDAGREATEDWRTIKDCYFLRCEIPRSVLVITEDCMFEDCKILDDLDPAIGSTRVNVTVYHGEKEFENPPGAYGPSVFIVKDGSRLNRKPGSNLSFQILDGRLDFH